LWFIDLKLGNICNLKCRICGSWSSSKWAKEEIDYVPGIDRKTHLAYKFLQDGAWPRENELFWDNLRILLPNIKYLEFTGGEPFLIPRFKELLALVGSRDTQPEIVITTNLTVVNDDIKYTLSKIKKLSLIISVDAWGKVNEYHRWPMTWAKFLQNFEWAKTLNCFLQFNTVIDAVTVLNCHELQQLENQIQNWSLTELVWPRALHLNNLPDQIKSQAQENFLQLKNSRFYQQNLTFRTVVDSIIMSLPTRGDPDALREYITTIDQRRGIDHSQYLGIKLT
jgi:sulfatase maturation enzyme AslB (radical SAM superfamily)